MRNIQILILILSKIELLLLRNVIWRSHNVFIIFFVDFFLIDWITFNNKQTPTCINIKACLVKRILFIILHCFTYFFLSLILIIWKQYIFDLCNGWIESFERKWLLIYGPPLKYFRRAKVYSLEPGFCAFPDYGFRNFASVFVRE